MNGFTDQEARVIAIDGHNGSGHAWIGVDAFELSDTQATGGSGGGTAYLDEDFEDGQAQGWTPLTGNWTVKNVDSSNRYVLESSGVGVNQPSFAR